MFLGQTFDPSDVGTIGLLVLLEGTLSVDNALVLGVVAARVPAHVAGKALAYGLGGAFIFRLIAVVLASFLLRWSFLKPVGALYLVYLFVRRFFFPPRRPVGKIPGDGEASFWRSVLVIELTDMTFAVDNVLAAVALVGPAPAATGAGQVHPKLWVILTGGMLGVILTRFAASACIGLLRRFPRLDACAYCIVLLVACKLGLEWMGIDFQDSHRAPCWAFWGLLAACLGVGFLPRRAGPLPYPPSGR
jgi:YkoY family integral membrane protein